MDSLTREQWRAIYDQALELNECTQGWYNRNYRAYLPDGRPVIVRAPTNRRDDMEPRQFDEARILQAARTAGVRVPKVLWQESEPPFQVHEFLNGTIVNEVAPRGTELPTTFIEEVVSALVLLGDVQSAMLDASGESTGTDFLRSLINRERRIYQWCRSGMPQIYQWLRLPDDPFEIVFVEAGRLNCRPFRLCHGDIERRNCLIYDGEIAFLDWELALWADPLWDLSIHVTRTQYLGAEAQRFLELVQNRLPAVALSGLMPDMDVYARYEYLRAAVNDTYRYVAGVMTNSTQQTATELAYELEWKFRLAAEVVPMRSVSADAIEVALRRQAHVLREDL